MVNSSSAAAGCNCCVVFLIFIATGLPLMNQHTFECPYSANAGSGAACDLNTTTTDCTGDNEICTQTVGGTCQNIGEVLCVGSSANVGGSVLLGEGLFGSGMWRNGEQCNYGSCSYSCGFYYCTCECYTYTTFYDNGWDFYDVESWQKAAQAFGILACIFGVLSVGLAVAAGGDPGKGKAAGAVSFFTAICCMIVFALWEAKFCETTFSSIGDISAENLFGCDRGASYGLFVASMVFMLITSIMLCLMPNDGGGGGNAAYV